MGALFLGFFSKKKPRALMAGQVTADSDFDFSQYEHRDVTRRAHAPPRTPQCGGGSVTDESMTDESVTDESAAVGPEGGVDTRKAPVGAVRQNSAKEILVFDTETNGFTGSVIQMGYVIWDDLGHEKQAYCKLWRIGEVVSFDERASQVHRITRADLEAHGVDPIPELHRLFALLTSNEYRVVCHNATFDIGRLNYTKNVNGLGDAYADLEVSSALCTMQKSMPHCSFYNKAGRKKAPRNDELYEFLLQSRPMVELHDALNDARITAEIYCKGHSRRWW